MTNVKDDTVVVDENNNSNAKVIGIMGGPGTGKTYSMELIESNLDELGTHVEVERPLTLVIARKSTTRESRGADDRLKEAGVHPNEFIPDNMIGIYTLQNNGAQYAYRKDAFDIDADIIIAEPSLHHIHEVRDHLGDRLKMVTLVASRKYRYDRMTERGTEEIDQVTKRLIEGDVQVFLLDKLTNGLERNIEDLIDPDLYTVLENIHMNHDDSEALASHSAALESMIGKEAREYANMVVNVAKRQDNDGLKVIDNVIYLDESYLSTSENSNTKLKDEIIGIVSDALKES